MPAIAQGNEVMRSLAVRTVTLAYRSLLVVFLLWIFAYNVLHVPYKLGTDGQKIRCLPWSVFLIKEGMPEAIRKGDLIQFHTTDVGYGFDRFKWVKMVGAVPGDRVEIRGDELRINGVLVDRLWLLKTLHKNPGDFDKSFVIPQGKYFMIGTTKESYDSRYWGLISQGQIIGSAKALF